MQRCLGKIRHFTSHLPNDTANPGGLGSWDRPSSDVSVASAHQAAEIFRTSALRKACAAAAPSPIQTASVDNPLEYIGITPPSLCKPPKLGSPARCERQKIAAAQIFETLCLHAILQMPKNNQLLIRFRGFLKWGGTLFHPF